MIRALKKSLLNAKQDPMQTRRFKTVTINQPVFSLPADAINGQLSVSVKGNTRNNLVKSSNMDKDTNADGVVDDFTKNVNPAVTGIVTYDSIKKAQKLEITASTGAGNIDINQDILIKAGEIITIYAECETSGLSPAGGSNANAQIHIGWFDAGNTSLGTAGISQKLVNSSFSILKAENLTAPANTTYAKLYCRLHATVAGDVGIVWFKNALVEKATTVGSYISSGVKSTLPVRVKSVGKNLLNLTKGSITANGVTCIVDEDDTVTLNGTATASFYIKLTDGLVADSANFLTWCNLYSTVKLQNVSYAHSRTLISGTASITPSFNLRNENNIGIYGVQTVPTISVNASLKGAFYYIFISSGAVLNNYKVKMQFEQNTIATEWESHRFTEAYLPEVGKSLLVGTKDEVNVDANGQWQKIQRVSNNVITTSISFTDMTNNRTTRIFNTDIVALLSTAVRLIDNATGNVVENVNESVKDDIANRGKYYILASSGAIFLISALGVNPTLNHTLNYQLKDVQYKYYIPEVQLGCPDGLKSFKGGTIIVEPIGDPAESTLPEIVLTYEVAA
jgi:hypothetical protein